MRALRRWWWVGLVCAAGASAGCGLEPKRSGGGAGGAAGYLAAAHPLDPSELRVHPLTRLTWSEGGARLVVHLELLDRWGHGTKGLGVFSVALYRAGRAADLRREVARWRVDLTDPEANAGPYDRVTRTYRLELAGIELGDGETSNLEVEARFVGTATDPLLARHRVMVPARGGG
jgi:hypothetical protein